MEKRDFAPLTGALFVVLIVVAIVITGSSPDGDASAQKVISYYADHKNQEIVASLLAVLSIVPLLYFSSLLRERARAALRSDSPLPGLVSGTGVVAAAGIGAAIATNIALVDYSDNVTPGGAQAMNAISSDMFFAFVVGVGLFILAVSLATLRSRLLPAGFAWTGFVLFVAALTPAGWIAFLLSGIWIIAASVVLYRGSHQRRPVSAEAAAA
jgi:hypothetical protein